MQQALAYQLRAPASMGGAPAGMRRVRLVATDAAITVGEGPEVHGRLLELLMAATGRPWHQGALTGDGVGLLRD